MLKMRSTQTIIYKLIAATLGMISVFAGTAFARHGDETVLPNRIPEPAPYVVSESAPGGSYKPPFPWAANDNDSGRCNGCHTVIFKHWNGAMMSNAWRDPGWRGAFLLVARATSTDGCNDIPLNNGKAADGSQGYDCQTDPATGKPRSLNPFANANGTSTFKLEGTTTKVTTGSGSVMDDFCSRCHMPTDYIDATISVKNDSPSGLEHGDISPTFDPTEIGATTLTDPGAGIGLKNADGTPFTYTGVTAYESFGERLDGTRTVNSNSGKAGITCVMCHSNVDSKYTPYNNFQKNGTEYYPVNTTASRLTALPVNQQDMFADPDTSLANLGYGIGAGSFRVSPHAVNNKERFGPIAANAPSTVEDVYLSQVFDTTVKYNVIQGTGTHDKFYQAKFERSEFCGSCHDVTNPITVKNPYGYWAGGFPIERTFSEWLNSRYAKRAGSPTNSYGADGKWERDCQSCHMQQTFGQAGTALTLFDGTGTSKAPMTGPSHDAIDRTPHWTHHFVGGNAYITKMIGSDVDSTGKVMPYPELLNTSFSSYDPSSRLNYARFTKDGTVNVVRQTQHERFAWDRLRNALSMSVKVNGTLAPAPASIAKPSSETVVPMDISLVNSGSGHNFPTGFPEGRAGWVKIAAWDTRGGTVTSPYQLVDGKSVELQIETKMTTVDGRSLTSRSLGVGYLTNQYMERDPNYALTCSVKDVELPVGSIDPYALQFKAVATMDKKCPTLDLPYATAVNMKVNADGVPVDANGLPVDRANPLRKPAYEDIDRDGEVFDDSYLMDTRLRPQPHAGATVNIASRGNAKKYYSIVVPATLPSGLAVQGPIAVSVATYYQSFEAVVARKFLGNLANTDDDVHDKAEVVNGVGPKGLRLEPCVLKGQCNRASNDSELRTALLYDPIVVEGAPPVPMEVASSLINFTKTTDTVAPKLVINNSIASPNTTAAIPANNHWSPSPYGGATGNFATEGFGEINVDHRRVIKVSFTEPVKGVNSNTFYLTDPNGRVVKSVVDQIDDTTWALFPFETEDSGSTMGEAFLGGGGYVLHVAPSVTVAGTTYSITDLNGLKLADGPAANKEYTFGFKVQ